MKIKCTEGKSVGVLRREDNLVRVFVDNDFHCGYWVVESQLLELVGEELRQEYLRATGDITLEVEATTAQQIIDMSLTPYNKVRVA